MGLFDALAGLGGAMGGIYRETSFYDQQRGQGLYDLRNYERQLRDYFGFTEIATTTTGTSTSPTTDENFVFKPKTYRGELQVETDKWLGGDAE